MKKIRDFIPRFPLSGSPSTSTRHRPHWLRRAGLALLATLAAVPASFGVGLPEISVEQPAGTALAGGVVAWGGNNFGQTDVPAALHSGVQAIAARYFQTVALKSDGGVVAWGLSASPASVPVAARSGVRAISAGFYDTAAIKTDGSVVVWGNDGFDLTNVPVQAQTGVQGIAVGFFHMVAVKDNGDVIAWGDNIYGLTTVPVAAQTGVTAVAAGVQHAAALKSDGSVVAWGDNGAGQTTVPVAAQTGVQAISAGDYHTVALKSDGSVIAWGDNTYGQRTVPVAAQSGVQAIYAGARHTLALKTDGTIVGWGENGAGQTVAPAAAQRGVQAIAGGVLHSVALIRAAGFGDQAIATSSAAKIFTIKNIGGAALNVTSASVTGADAAAFTLDTTGMLSSVPATTGATTFSVTFTPSSIGEKTATLRVQSDDPNEPAYDIALTGTGIVVPEITIEQPAGTALGSSVVAWGRNDNGQTDVPVAAQSGVQAITAGNNHTVALKSDGTVVAWGENSSGQATVPSGLAGVQAIAGGGYHTLAAKSDGTVVAWGWSSSGQTSVPIGLTGVQAVAGGYAHSVALKSDGTVVAWGLNDFGQRNVPGGLTSVVAIAAGDRHTVALKSDGTVMAWGRNASGQTSVPDGLTGVTAIAALGDHTVVLKNDGTVVAWGDNGSGQTTVPTGLNGVQAIAAGGVHTVALKSDGSVVAWGGNSEGQTTVPDGLTGVQAIAGGGSYTVALRNPVVAFGDQSVTTTSTAKTFTIKNTGAAALAISGVSVAGADAADFTVSTTGMLSSVPATTGETTFTVTFAPSETGPRTATLRVLSDDPDDATTDIVLTGNGVAAPLPTINAFTSAGRPIDIDVIGAQLQRGSSVPTITILTQPAQGVASVVNGKIRFTPGAGFPSAGDRFTYQIDTDGEIVNGTVQVVNFTSVAGDYDGLIEDTGDVTDAEAHQHGGHLRLNVSNTGSFSGVITFAGVEVRSAVRVGFRGVGRANQFGALGRETLAIKRPPQAPITVALEYSTEQNAIVGTVSSIDGNGHEFESTFTLLPQAADDEAAGGYTLRIAPDDTEGTPQGTGFAAVKVARNGTVTYAGKLADGTPYSGGAYRHDDGGFALYSELYRSMLTDRGSLRGNVESPFERGRSLRSRGSSLAWFKPTRARDDYFPEGFGVNRAAELYRYQKPAHGTRVLDFSSGTGNGRFRITHGDLEVDEAITLATDNRASVVGLSASGLSLRFNTQAGFFMGHFKHPTTQKRTPFAGAVFQQDRFGGGYFMGDGPIDGCSVQIEDTDR